MSIDEILEILPNPPKFDRKDVAWQQVTVAARMMSMTPQGFLQWRERFYHSFEVQHKNNVYVHFPSWLNLHILYNATR